MSSLLLGIICFSAIYLCHGEQSVWLPQEYPNPMDMADNDRCGLYGSPMYICDTINVLTGLQLEYLNNLINEGINNTECICSAARCRDDGERGPRIGIALLETINTDLPGGTGRNSKIHNAIAFSDGLNAHWSFGPCDNDITIIYESTTNVYMTFVGKALRPYLTTEILGEIAYDARPFIGRGLDMFEGLQLLITNYYNVLNGSYKRQYPKDFGYEPQVGERRGSGVDQLHGATILLTIGGVIMGLLMK